jgi:hypothetical protein
MFIYLSLSFPLLFSLLLFRVVIYIHSTLLVLLVSYSLFSIHRSIFPISFQINLKNVIIRLTYSFMAIIILICCILKNYPLRPWQSDTLNIVVFFTAFMFTRLLLQDGVIVIDAQVEQARS